MTIGFDGSRSFISYRTGTENYSYNLLRALAKLDCVNTYKVYLRPGCKVEGTWPSNFQFSIINPPVLWTQVGLALRTFFDPLDILFVPAHTIPVIRRPGLKTVMTVHDLGSEYLPGLHKFKQRLYLKFVTDIQLKTATRLIAVSQATKIDLMQKVGVGEKRIAVVYEGSNFKQKNDLKSDTLKDVLKSYEIENSKYILFVGTVQPRKNLARLITAYRGLCNILGKNTPDLVIVGNRGWLSDEIYRLPKVLGIGDRVKFLGRVSDQDLPYLYKGAKFFVFPSLYEGFGLPILEAFSLGCPVLTSNVSSMPEVAGNAAVLVNPRSSEEILDGMVKLCTDDKLKCGLVEKGYKRVRIFSWEKAAIQTLKVFGQL